MYVSLALLLSPTPSAPVAQQLKSTTATDRGGQRDRQAGKANFHFRASASPRGSPNPIRQSGAGYFCAKLGIFKPQSVQPILSGSLVCPAATATVLAALREGVLGYLGLSLPMTDLRGHRLRTR